MSNIVDFPSDQTPGVELENFLISYTDPAYFARREEAKEALTEFLNETHGSTVITTALLDVFTHHGEYLANVKETTSGWNLGQAMPTAVFDEDEYNIIFAADDMVISPTMLVFNILLDPDEIDQLTIDDNNKKGLESPRIAVDRVTTAFGTDVHNAELLFQGFQEQYPCSTIFASEVCLGSNSQEIHNSYTACTSVDLGVEGTIYIGGSLVVLKGTVETSTIARHLWEPKNNIKH